LTVGNHGPVQVQVLNPISARTLNRYDVNWNISVVPDARAKLLGARRVRVSVTPIDAAGANNSKPLWNKIVNMTTIFSARIP
jgi:hypothetical protein